MNDLPRKRLAEIVASYGREIGSDARRCRGLLNDLCPNARREINVLVGAIEEQIPSDLLTSSGGAHYEFEASRLSKRLIDHRAIAEEAAKWAVESWAIALGIAEHPSPGLKSTNGTERIRVQCPHCRVRGSVRASRIGTMIGCSRCTRRFAANPVDFEVEDASRFDKIAIEEIEFGLVPPASHPSTSSISGTDPSNPLSIQTTRQLSLLDQQPTPIDLVGDSSIMQRVGAAFLDLMVSMFVAAFVCALANSPESTAGLFLWVYLVYDWLATGSKSQATLGKHVLGLRVTKVDGGRLTIGYALLRSSGKVLSYLPCFMGFLLPLVTNRRRALHDFVAGTVVVNVRK